MNVAVAAPLVAFHGEQAIKDKYLGRVKMHREADNLVCGIGWENGRGCAVGCTLEKYDHAAYEAELGIPRILARLEDCLFENLPKSLAMAWPERFLAAIKPGADLSLVASRWFVWLLVDPTDGVLRFAKSKRSQKAIQRVADLYTRKISGEQVAEREFRAAAAAAAASYAADAAADAAAAAAYAAAYAAAAAAAAADAAAASYAADAAAAAAAADAGSQARVKQANKLIELLEAA